MIVHCHPTPFELAPVRSFLSALGYRPASRPERLALLLVGPLDDAAVEIRRSSHLTDATDRDSQLRFFSERLVQQHILTLARASADRFPGVDHVELRGGEHLTGAAALFFRVLALHLPGCDLRVRFGGARRESDPHEPDAEARVRHLYQRDRSADDGAFEVMFDAARSCTYVGDYRTSERLLARLERARPHREVNVLLGIAANATSRPFLAEHYFERNHRGNDVIDKIRACYSLAMLCIRHHAPSFLDLERGEAYLDEAYDLLAHLDPADENPDLAFKKVFNRNGHALVLFKQKRIAEALASLDRGIARLGELEGAAVALHQSVLVYNKMLCHRALGDDTSELECFRRLIELDPLYPYYRLDLARSLMARSRIEEAIDTAEQARAIDPFIADAESILGRCHQRLGRAALAEEHLTRAIELDPLDPCHRCHLAILWNEQGAHARTLAALRNEEVESWSDAAYESAVCLQAEATVIVHDDPGEARAILERGISRLDGSARLRRNLELVTAVAGAA